MNKNTKAPKKRSWVTTIRRTKKAVSPVIATVLLIVLTAASVAVIWTLVLNKTASSSQPELALTSGLSYSDAGGDADILVDSVSFNVKNLGTKEAALDSVTVQQTNIYNWEISAPATTITRGASAVVTIKTSVPGEQLVEGEVTILLKYGDSLLQMTGNVPSGESVDVTFLVNNAISYQNEGTTTSSDVSTLISSLDGTTAPDVPDGTVTFPYYATGGSNRYFDALALNFDVGGLSSATHTATLRVFLFDGGYSTTWHHYLILQNQFNSSYQNVAPPVPSIPWDDNVDNGPDPLQIDILLLSFEWNTGDFWITLRLWDAKIDLIQLIVTPNA